MRTGLRHPVPGAATMRVALALAALVAPLALAAQPAQQTPQAASRQRTATSPRAAVVATVPVAAHALPRGHVLTAEDIALAPDAVPVDARRSTLTGPIGWVTRRMIAAGEALRAPAVAPPDAVRAGQPVAVVYRDGGLALRLAGTATSNAPVGQRVAVRVESNGRTRRLEGTVVAAGVVAIR
jgi:flagella basal body P-ring formation protein FlgA